MTSRDNAKIRPEAEETDEARRELLKKLGEIAVYTPPTLMALMVSRKASAQLGSPPAPPA